jgi:RES domain
MSWIETPPANFNRLQLATLAVDAAALVRLARANPATHIDFRRSAQFRFDSPDRSFGVLYAAFDLTTAFLETVLRNKPQAVRVGEPVILDYAEVDARRVVTLQPAASAKPLKLIKLYDEGLVAAKTDNSISSVDDYPTTQRWSKAFHDHPLAADGVVYMSRYIGSRRSVALFDRCADAIGIESITNLLTHPEFAEILDTYGLGIEPP